MASPLVIGFVGDLLIDRDNPDEVFDDVRGLLDAPDILFGNMEAVYVAPQDVEPLVTSPMILHGPPQGLGAIIRAGFDVLSLANNHSVDCGHAPLLSNLADLRAAGVATCGVGANIAEARTAAVVEKGGLRTAFLAYASIFPMGSEARETTPGLAPVRLTNIYHTVPDTYRMPGVLPAYVTTAPEAADLAALRADIARARARADLVVASFHWGDHTRPHHLTDHEKREARFCLDHGADIVVGHHHHKVRGMEWYGGKPILYGVGHFVFDFRVDFTGELAALVDGADDPNNHGMAPRAGWPLMPFHADSRMTMMAWVEMDGAHPAGMGFIPCRLRPDGRVQAVDPDSEEGREVVAYMEKNQASQGLNGRIERGGPALGGHGSLRVVPLD